MNRSPVSRTLKMLFTAAAALSVLSTGALAQTIYLAGPGGSIEQRYRKVVIPAFEKQHGVTIQYVAAQTPEILAKLEAQKSNQELDAVLLADGAMLQAEERGFCAPLADAPVYSELIPEAKLSKNSIGVTSVYTVIAINEKVFAKKNLPEPKSWKDLGNPKYNGELALLSAGSSNTGLHGLVMTARAVGGGEKNIDPGFVYLKEKVRPNLITLVQSAAKMAEMLQTGEASIGVSVSSRASALKASGAPIKIIVPEEGSPVAMTAVCPIVGSDMADLTQKLIQFMVSVEGQKGIEVGEAPVNRNAISSGESMPKLTALDWATVNKNRNAWIDRWNREIE